MEERDLTLIRRYESSDKVLANLYREHIRYEEELSMLEGRGYTTQEDELRIKELKKKKLLGRDRMELILRKYRASGGED